LQLASDKAGDDAVVIGNILLAKPHDIRRTGCLILLGLGECRTGAYDQCSNDKSELFHISSQYTKKETLNFCDSSPRQGIFSEQKAFLPVPHAIVGITDEGAETMKEYKGSPALDAGLLAAAQASNIMRCRDTARSRPGRCKSD